MFIKNGWYVAAWAAELQNEPMAVEIAGENIVLFRDKAGQAHAFEDRCAHRGVPLSRGHVTEHGLECGYHGVTFGAGGRCTHLPHQNSIPNSMCVNSFAVHEQDQVIWVWPGSDPADVTKIPNFPYHQTWSGQIGGILTVNANHELFVENLMDLTHVGYLHPGTIGGDAQTHVDAVQDTVKTETGVKFTRWYMNVMPPPFYAAMKFPGKINRWQEMEFISPGTVVLYTGGIDSVYGQDRSDLSQGVHNRFLLALTPNNQNQCQVFYSVNRSHLPNVATLTEKMFKDITQVLTEDAEMVEAQHANFTKFPDRPLTNIVSDFARILAQRHIDAQKTGG
jgi:vanillate O-demethylase monooxygenase subunit